MKKVTAILFLLAGLLSTLPADAQERGALPGVLPDFNPLPRVDLLPANITLYNSGISLLPAGQDLHGFSGYKSENPRFLSDLNTWKRNYIRDNNLRNILPNPTLVNGDVMGYALRNRSMANQELYHTYVLMNSKNAGNTQLGRMYGGPGSVAYIDFIGLGLMAAEYLIYLLER